MNILDENKTLHLKLQTLLATGNGWEILTENGWITNFEDLFEYNRKGRRDVGVQGRDGHCKVGTGQKLNHERMLLMKKKKKKKKLQQNKVG